MKQYITIEQADTLVEKYYEGLTTTDEEALLQEFLEQEDLPSRFDAERAMFGYFSTEKMRLVPLIAAFEDRSTEAEATNPSDLEKKPPRSIMLRMTPLLKGSFAAAVALFGVFIVEHQLMASSSNYAYINGIRYTDNKTIKSLAIASIEDMDLKSDEVEKTLDKMNDKNLVESQLENFPSFE
jgi:hypothetical protein